MSSLPVQRSVPQSWEGLGGPLAPTTTGITSFLQKDPAEAPSTGFNAIPMFLAWLIIFHFQSLAFFIPGIYKLSSGNSAPSFWPFQPTLSQQHTPVLWGETWQGDGI